VTFKSFISLAILFTLIVCMAGQLLIDSNITNTSSTLIIAITTISTIAYLYWGDAYSKTPISATVVLSLLFTGLFGALFFQTIYWNPVTKYLYNPINTFFKLAFYQLLGIGSHYAYLLFQKDKYKAGVANTFSLKRVLSKIGLYDVPSVYTVWIISIVGIFAYILAKLLSGTLGNILLNLKFLIWFPFFILFYIYKFGRDYASPPRQYSLILIFFIAVAIIGIMFNTRAIIITGIVNLFLITIISLLNKNPRYRIGVYGLFSIIALSIISLLKPLSDFSDAMLAARAERENITGIEMMINTFDLYSKLDNANLLHNDKFIENKVYTSYDEIYIENGILNRFVLTKFHDNAFHFSSKVTNNGKQEVITHINDSLIAILPQPLLELLGIELNKEHLQKTTTDILVHEASGRRLGGYKVPSTFAEIELVFGSLAPIVFLCMTFVFFSIIDLFSVTNKSNGLFISLPFFGMASVYIFFQIPIYSLIGVITLLVRSFVQDVLIFCLLMYALSYIFKPFRKNTRV